jgi:type I restriction enzyme R subunit
VAAAGYTDDEAAAIRTEIAHYVDVRAEVKIGANENVDFTRYEAGMRHLLDTYISATPSQVVSDFGDTGLIELIAQLGAGAIDKLPRGIRKDREAVAETITNNVRKVIVDEHAMNPKYYDRMSELLDAILEQRRQGALDYEAYLAELLEHAAKLGRGESDTRPTPRTRNGPTTAPAAPSSTSSRSRRPPWRSTGRSGTPSRTPGSATRCGSAGSSAR